MTADWATYYYPLPQKPFHLPPEIKQPLCPQSVSVSKGYKIRGRCCNCSWLPGSTADSFWGLMIMWMGLSPPVSVFSPVSPLSPGPRSHVFSSADAPTGLRRSVAAVLPPFPEFPFLIFSSPLTVTFSAVYEKGVCAVNKLTFKIPELMQMKNKHRRKTGENWWDGVSGRLILLLPAFFMQRPLWDIYLLWAALQCVRGAVLGAQWGIDPFTSLAVGCFAVCMLIAVVCTTQRLQGIPWKVGLRAVLLGPCLLNPIMAHGLIWCHAFGRVPPVWHSERVRWQCQTAVTDERASMLSTLTSGTV